MMGMVRRRIKFVDIFINDKKVKGKMRLQLQLDSVNPLLKMRFYYSIIPPTKVPPRVSTLLFFPLSLISFLLHQISPLMPSCIQDIDTEHMYLQLTVTPALSMQSFLIVCQTTMKPFPLEHKTLILEMDCIRSQNLMLLDAVEMRN